MSTETARRLVALMWVALVALWGASAPAQTPSTDDILSRIETVLRDQPTATPAPTPSTESEQRYRQLVGVIQSQTEAIWGRSAGRALEPIVLSTDDASKLLNDLLAAELNKPEIIAIDHFMRHFELIPRDVPIERLFQDLMEGQLGGLFNPETKQLYVIDTFDTQGFVGKVILSHEITHALQDVHFDLLEFYRNQPNLDTMKARHAVLEGDATVAMMEWAVKHGTPADLLSMGSLFGDQTKGLDNAPPALVQDLLFSYIAGMNFANAIQAKYPDDWRRRIFTDPPTTTRHILHPETYLQEPRFEPRQVSLGNPPANSNYEELYRTSMGEWNLRLFLTPPSAFPRIGPFTLDPIVKEPVSTNAAAGWRGDTMAILTPRGQARGDAVVVWKLAFNGPAETNAFVSALLRRFGSMDNFARQTLPSAIPAGAPHEIRGNKQNAFIVRTRDQVFMVLAATPEGMEAGKALLAP